MNTTMCKINKYLLLSLMLLLSWGVKMTAQPQYTEAELDSLRQTEDFVTASICVADPTHWRDDILGTKGHAFIRLQCPTFGMDYCFSYETDSINQHLNRYFMGKLKMGMFCYPTDSYIEDYRVWNRAVHEYVLNLPPLVETRLWEVMDNHVTNKLSLKLDMDKRGCSNSLVYFLEKALAGTPIEYEDGVDLRMLCIPANLLTAWQHASVDGRPLLTYKGALVDAPPVTWWDVYWDWSTFVLIFVVLAAITVGIINFIVRRKKR